jgi:hypothetical protein
LNGETLSRTYFPEMPDFEVYDLPVLPAGTRLSPSEVRIVMVEHIMFARLHYAALMTALADVRVLTVPTGPS